MTDRDRLIDLIHDSDLSLDSVRLADHLLANGVIVPPCKVGDSIYRVGNGEIWEWLIAMAYVHPDETIYVDDCSEIQCQFQYDCESCRHQAGCEAESEAQGE